MSIELNSIRLVGPAHGIVVKTVNKTLRGGGEGGRGSRGRGWGWGWGMVNLVTDLKVNLISKFTCCLSVYLSISSVVVVFFPEYGVVLRIA